MLCPSCQMENPDDAVRCSQCLTAFNTAPAASTPLVNEAPIVLPPYRPSGRVTPSGLLTLAAATIIGPALLGYLYFRIAAYDSSLTYGKIGLVIAAVLGMALGGAMYGIARVGKLRNPLLLALVGTLGGALIFGMRLEYEAYSPGTRAMVVTDLSLPSRPPANPISALTDYVSWLCDGRIVRTGTGSSGGTPLTGADFWFEFLFPALGALGGCAAVAYQGAKQPYCEKCNVWTVDKTILKNHPKASAMILDRINAGDWAQVRQMPVMGAVTTKNVCAVSIIRCEQCFDSFVMVKNTVGGREKQIFYGQVAPDVADRFMTGKAAG